MNSRLLINHKYPFAYDTHLHTSQGSACAKSKGRNLAKVYKSAGYTGIIVTDHFFYGNTAIKRTLSWEEWVYNFCRGYEDAKNEGDKISLQVFFGWESGYNGTEFLIYGLDKQWLLNHPEIKDATVEEQHSYVKKSGGIVIHAHPFREAFYIPKIMLYPEYVDGVEVLNSTHSNKNNTSHYNLKYDKNALDYAKKHHLPMTSGTDNHSTSLLCGGMAFKRKLIDINDFINIVINKENYYLFARNGKITIHNI